MPSLHSKEDDGASLIAPPVPQRRASRLEMQMQKHKSLFLPERKVTCVLVGDGAVGKTSLVVSYTTNGFPSEYIPTTLDNFAALVVVDGKPVRLQLCDVSGERWLTPTGKHNEEFAQLRSLCYKNADIFLLCYSVVLPSSFHSVTSRWASEIHRLCPDAPIILVGTQSDLREDVHVLIQLAQNQEQPITTEEARVCAQHINAVTFTECSALTQKNLKEVFDTAILASMQDNEILQQNHCLTKTPKKIRKLSESWWKKFSCIGGTNMPQ
ncbi:rho-related GTP-binding protein RhoU [Alosa sapidissima]|nr:rho-related GTP-binding protein RhoU [Alosa sapidissima]